MATDKYVKPAHKDLIVRYPNNMVILPKTGGWVPWIGRDGRYWRRRFKDGSIEECKPETKKVIKNEKKKEGHK